MMKSLRNRLKQDREKYVVPKTVQDYIPITVIYEDGIFRIGNKYSQRHLSFLRYKKGDHIV